MTTLQREQRWLPAWSRRGGLYVPSKTPSSLVVASVLTSGSDVTDATSYVSASITPAANALILGVIHVRKSAATVSNPTATGNGLTWVEEKTIANGNTRRLNVFRAMDASPTTGAVTFDLGGVTHLHAIWAILQFTNVDTTGTNGSGAVPQSATTSGSGTSGTATLAAFGNVNNATFGAWGIQNNENITPGSGFTEETDVGITDGAAQLVLETEFKNTNDTSVDASWTTSDTYRGIALEIKAA